MGELLSPQEFEALEGSAVVAVPLVRKRGDRPDDVLGVLFVKARNIEVVDGKLSLRESVLRALVSSTS